VESTLTWGEVQGGGRGRGGVGSRLRGREWVGNPPDMHPTAAAEVWPGRAGQGKAGPPTGHTHMQRKRMHTEAHHKLKLMPPHK
jgi:hypothetical protein